MPQIIITEQALRGMKRCRDFLNAKSPDVAIRAAQAIEASLFLLETMPNMGRPWRERPELRELVISFGESGYVAMYRYMPNENLIYVLAFRHQKEAGY